MPHSKGFAHRRDRRSADPVSLGDVMDGLLSEDALARGLPIAALASHWTDVVGPRLAAETAPVGLEAGVLIVRATNGPWGAQARFLTDQIRANANRQLGSEQVTTVRVVVAARGPLRS